MIIQDECLELSVVIINQTVYFSYHGVRRGFPLDCMRMLTKTEGYPPLIKIGQLLMRGTFAFISADPR